MRQTVTGQPIVRRLLPPWILGSHSRYCPRCLAGDGSPIQQLHGGPWRRRWRLATSFACVTHRVFLQHQCPACHHPAGFTGPNTITLLASPELEDLHPACCRTRVAFRTACRHRLDRVESAALPGDLADLQARLDRLLDPDTDPGHAYETFANLQVVTAMILATWPAMSELVTTDQEAVIDEHLAAQQQLLATFHPNRAYRDEGVFWTHLPRRPIGAAGVLSAADQLLALPSADRRRELHRLIQTMPDRDEKRWGMTWKILVRDPSPDLRALISEALPKPPPKPRLPPGTWHRKHLVSSVLPQRILKLDGYSAQNIPQELPEPWFRICEPEITNPLPAITRRFRRVISIQLVQAVSGMDPQQAAEYLGLPIGSNLLNTEGPTQPPLRRLQPYIREQDGKLARLAEHLATLPQTEHVDYQQRRERFALWHLPADDFEGLLDRLIAGTGRPSPAPLDRLHEALSAIIWHRITGSELVLAPCFRPPLSPAGRIIDLHSPPVSLARRIQQATHRSPYRTLLPALVQITDSLLHGPAPACPSQSVTTERPPAAN